MKAYVVVKRKNRKIYTSTSSKRLIINKSVKLNFNMAKCAIYKQLNSAIKIFKSFPWSNLSVYKCEVELFKNQPISEIILCNRITLIKKIL